MRSIRSILLALGLFGLLAPATARGANARKLVALGPCKDGAYHLNGSRWTTPLRWSFRASTTPKGVKASAAEAAFERAARNIVTGRNSCGLPDRISATEGYLGRTSRPTDVRDDSTCGTPDGRSVIAFGTLAPTDMAVTCWWNVNGRIVEADIKLNKAYYKWTDRIPPGCALTWSIEAVATHEFGHAFGLNHVAEGLHGNLTMSPLIAPCQVSETTLGLGDIRGLERMY